MKIYIFTLSVILAFTISAFGQIKAPKGFTADYDKFKDKTLVGFTGWANGIQYIAEFELSGQSVSEDVKYFYLTFAPNRCYGFCFDDAKLIALLDGKPMPLGTDDGLGNTATFLIQREDFTKIANAVTGEFQVGRFEGKWEGKMLAKFKTLLDLGTWQKPAQ